MRKCFLLFQIAVLATAVCFVVIPSQTRANSSRVLVEKKYWSSAGSEQYTFGPGETVIASISFNLLDDTVNEVDVLDKVPNRGLGPVKLTDPAKCHIPTGSVVENVSFSETGKDLKWGPFVLNSQTPKYLCYQFSIDTSLAAKNYAEQVEVRVQKSATDIAIGNENNYLLIVGSLWGDSMASPPVVETPGADGKIPSVGTKIDDKVVKDSVRIKTQGDVDLSKYPSFLYQSSAGKTSRGGYFNSYPVKVTNKTGDATYGVENYYLFYNPLYYLFGNVFSGGSATTRAFDFGSRGSTISKSDSNSKKLNSEATLYNYDFDKDSLIYWDRTNADKNKQMYDNIKKYISDPKPEIVCTLNSTAPFGSAIFYLNNKDCLSDGGANGGSLYPNGRVWYYRASQANNVINLTASFRGKGTLIIDFTDYTHGDVPIVNIKRNVTGSNYLGLIVINGGNVVLGTNVTQFNGIVFVPGRI